MRISKNLKERISDSESESTEMIPELACNALRSAICFRIAGVLRRILRWSKKCFLKLKQFKNFENGELSVRIVPLEANVLVLLAFFDVQALVRIVRVNGRSCLHTISYSSISQDSSLL